MSTAATAPAEHARAASVLQSGSAGVIVERVWEVRAGQRAQILAAQAARAAEVTALHSELASVFLFEEAFGTKNRLHRLVHARSLDAYEELERVAPTPWDALGAQGPVRETVLMPQFVGMYGTSLRDGADVPERRHAVGTAAVITPAQHQVESAPEDTLNSVTAGAIIHRTGQLRYEFRAEGREFAREVAAAINGKYGGDAVVFLYEEAFGAADRIHWLIHLRSLSTYYALIDGHAWAGEADRELYSRQRIAPEKGGGDWSRLLVEQGLRDVALTRVDAQPSDQSSVAGAVGASGVDR